jgi:hypothetical protein
VHLEAGVLPDKHTRGAGVIQVNVSQEQVVDVLKGQTAAGYPFF